MTKELRAALEVILQNLGAEPKNVLEIGSRVADNQDEICNLRPLLPQSQYIGVDMQAGAGVDVVAEATKLPYPPKSFELVLCLETLEHADNPWLIAKEIERVVKQKGAVILSSQQNFPIHLHPSDYFRYTPYGLTTLVPKNWKKIVFGISPPFEAEVKLNPKHVIVVAWGGAQWEKQKLKRQLKSAQSRISGHKPYRHRLQAMLKFFKRGFSELKYREEIHFFE